MDEKDRCAIFRLTVHGYHRYQSDSTDNHYVSAMPGVNSGGTVGVQVSAAAAILWAVAAGKQVVIHQDTGDTFFHVEGGVQFSECHASQACGMVIFSC